MDTQTSPIPLTPDQIQAAHLLAAGHSYAEVCSHLSVGRTTLYYWRQLPEFATYLNILTRQIADETLLQSTHLLTLSLKHIQETLAHPATSLADKTRLALRLLSLYSSPAYLKHLNSLPDNPNTALVAKMREETVGHPDARATIDNPENRANFTRLQHDLIRRAQSFDAQTAHLPSLNKIEHPAPAFELVTVTLSPDLPPVLPPELNKIEHPKTPSAKLAAAVAATFPKSTAA